MPESALFTDHIVHAGTTDTGMRFCQFWGDTKVAGMTAQVCFAAMGDRDDGVDFSVRSYCPTDLIPEVLDAYRLFLDGGNLQRTHTVVWDFGTPTFTTEGNKE